MSVSPYGLSVRGLSLSLGDFSMRNVSFHVAPGEILVIVGPSGSGKSTLIKTLIGTLPLMNGKVSILGSTWEAGKKPTGPQPGYKIGYVPQRLASAGGIESTVSEMVASGLLGSGHLRLPSNWRKRVQEALQQVGMLHRLREPFQDLSGGQQQRIPTPP